MNRVRPNRVSGFTLVELQIAFLLLVLISLLIAGALRLSAQTWGRVFAHQQDAERGFLAAEKLRTHLAGARFVSVPDDTGETHLSFFGGDDYLHFVAGFPSYDGAGELYWWTLKSHVFANRDQPALVLEYQPFDEQARVEEDAEHHLIIAGGIPEYVVIEPELREFAIQYYFRDDEQTAAAGQAAGWMFEAPRGDISPALLRLHIDTGKPIDSEKSTYAANTKARAEINGRGVLSVALNNSGTIHEGF